MNCFPCCLCVGASESRPRAVPGEPIRHAVCWNHSQYSSEGGRAGRGGGRWLHRTGHQQGRLHSPLCHPPGAPGHQVHHPSTHTICYCCKKAFCHTFSFQPFVWIVHFFVWVVHLLEQQPVDQKVKRSNPCQKEKQRCTSQTQSIVKSSSQKLIQTIIKTSS